VVGSLSEAAHGNGRVLYLAGFGGAGSADREVGSVVYSHPAEGDTLEIHLDAALIEPESHVNCDNTVRDTVTSCLSRDVEETADEDDPVVVHKRGSSTGETTGLLAPVPESLEVEGRLPDGSVIVRNYLRGFFVYGESGPFAKPGDSGSLVVDDDDCVVGMIVALRTADPNNVEPGDPAFVVPVGDLVTLLDIELVGPARVCTIV
jgi:hypothetical protein